MGVFKWLRRERVTVTTRRSVTPPASTSELNEPAQGTIRTEEYKRDLAEFQARRSLGSKEPDTPQKLKRCGHSSLPISCADCTDPDTTFNYEKKSANKYKKKKRSRSITPEKICDGVPNIQFLFQNQVFMPGLYPTYSEVKTKCYRRSRSPDFVSQKHIDYKETDVYVSPKFRKNNSLPFDVHNFLAGHRTDEEEVDGLHAAGDANASSNEANKDSSSGDDKVWEVLTELKQFDQWADEQLMIKSPVTGRSDDSKSDTSAYGLPIVSSRNVDIHVDKGKIWSLGTWGVVPVQLKKLTGVTVDRVRKKRSVEINILRKCRHPNIILLMGIYSDVENNVHIICERCVDSLFCILHVQGRILSAQTSVHYALDVANALVFLRMQGFIHTQLNSMSIMITSHDTAKLADFAPCACVINEDVYSKPKDYGMYTAEPRYVNIDDTHSKTSESEPLLSANPSEVYLKSNAVSKKYEDFANSEMFRWQAPELFAADEMGMVQACSKSDVYSLSLILWESCNASIPWKTLPYGKLKEQYMLWETGMPLPQNGTYPGGLLSLLQSGLKLKRTDRIDLDTLQRELQTVKRDLDDIDYVILPARLQRKKSNFSTTVWDTVSPTDSECQSPQHLEHKAVIHAKDAEDSSSLSEVSYRDTKSEATPLYETIKTTYATYSVAQKCKLPDYNDNTDCSAAKYDHLPDKDFSSACSTPIAKLRARIKDIDTPGALHRSDSTEYCSILSPNRTVNFYNNDDSKEQSCERSTAKLSRSFTPKSYKPLHIKVPDCNLDSIRPLLKDQNGFEKSSYNFDIKNYSLPTTPIARSNKLRKNAWLSGELRSSPEKESKFVNKTPPNNELQQDLEPPETSESEQKSSLCSPHTQANKIKCVLHDGEQSPASTESVRVGASGFKRVDPIDFSPGTDDTFVSMAEKNNVKYKDEDVLANINVKPLVAIHERWIYEANRKSGRSMSLPEDNSLRSHIPAVKPASHCVTTLQKSLPQLNTKKCKAFRRPPSPPSNGGNWEQFCQARETISKELNLPRDSDRYRTWSKDLDKGTTTDEAPDHKVNRSTDTIGIEDYIRDLIRKEFQLHLLSDNDDTLSTPTTEDILNKGVANIIESLNSDDPERTLKKEQPPKSQSTFSRVKINGNNKPLLQITFNRSGENSLQVLDNCVNVTICDNGKESQKFNVSLEDTLSEDVQVNALKRCQAFNAIQEARSTEDLYIDDDLSTHMNENFGGKVKLIPLHGSLHEILCEKEEDCCLIKVKQENGCDTIYFRCDNSDTESRDAIDGSEPNGDTVVFKRSISLIEERIQRIVPKDKRAPPKPKERPRPKSEIFAPIRRETRFFSNSSPSLATPSLNEVEVNIENVMSYQDSSSDECLNSRSPEHDDFEVLEKKIEQEVKISAFAAGLGYMDKISEENLATIDEES